MSKNHGGSRPGAGRRAGSGKYGVATKAIRIPSHLEQDIINLIHLKNACIPLYESKVSAGYPLPCDDSISEKLDFNCYLIKHPNATFALRVNGDSMIGAGIYENDLIIVDRSIEPFHGAIVVAAVDGHLTVKRLHKNKAECLLVPENDKYKSIDITKNCETVIWGVVIHVIRCISHDMI